MNKQCSQCGENKSLDLFHNENKAVDGKRANCKECVNKNRRERFNNNPEHDRAINKKSRMKPVNKLKNTERVKQWIKDNPIKVIEHRRKRCEKLRIDPHIKTLNKQLRRVKAIARLEYKRRLKKAYYKSIADSYTKDDIPIIKQWVDVKGYESLYRVSNYGEVYSLIRNKMMICVIEKLHRYARVNLYKDDSRVTHKVHRLVATAFIDNKHNKPYVNHIDFNRSNNIVNNLEWVTALENNIHYQAMK